MTVVSAAILLLLVIDPVGNVPYYVSALRQVPAGRHTAVALRELLIAYGVMVAFLFAGAPLLRLLRISEPALTIAGGIILFLIALRMVFPSADHAEDLAGEPFVVPLAIPYVAGPSVLATELLLMSREPQRWGSWLLALSAAWLATALVLTLAARFSSRISSRALVAAERLMGMILVAIATEMFLSGLAKYLGATAIR
ncbi:MAG TPA: MarC family protein [Thermoanaerobaculia bacterium]|nr:MarC family protein [Thermoanaerobaculia bacterium]